MGPSEPARAAGANTEAVVAAIGLVGTPYSWGGNSPAGGFDCSGLVHYVFLSAAAKNLPRTTAGLWAKGRHIERKSLTDGDLVFFDTDGASHSHVGIYVGKGRFVHAPRAGGTVRLEALTVPYWVRHFTGAARF
ncbi:NlpC/P60 family protein [Paraburkholderia sp. UCT31]|nr:NlpC/P60 family protein [Paraburkholderia sp. UCT31]